MRPPRISLYQLLQAAIKLYIVNDRQRDISPNIAKIAMAGRDIFADWKTISIPAAYDMRLLRNQRFFYVIYHHILLLTWAFCGGDFFMSWKSDDFKNGIDADSKEKSHPMQNGFLEGDISKCLLIKVLALQEPNYLGSWYAVDKQPRIFRIECIDQLAFCHGRQPTNFPDEQRRLCHHKALDNSLR